jgi:hypothetical protein
MKSSTASWRGILTFIEVAIFEGIGEERKY